MTSAVAQAPNINFAKEVYDLRWMTNTVGAIFIAPKLQRRAGRWQMRTELYGNIPQALWVQSYQLVIGSPADQTQRWAWLPPRQSNVGVFLEWGPPSQSKSSIINIYNNL